MNRVKRTAQLYMEQRPLIDRVRVVRSHTRRSRKLAMEVRRKKALLDAAQQSLSKMTKAELMEWAKRVGIPRRSRLTKAQLIKALLESE